MPPGESLWRACRGHREAGLATDVVVQAERVVARIIDHMPLTIDVEDDARGVRAGPTNTRGHVWLGMRAAHSSCIPWSRERCAMTALCHALIRQWH